MISVIMPAYNAEKYIGQAVESVLNQTYQDFELIIVDDGSTDNTKNILPGINPKIRYFPIPHSGIVTALNIGLSLAMGDYIARHDADDWSHPERFEKQVGVLNQGDWDVVGTSMLLVDENGFPTGVLCYPERVTLFGIFGQDHGLMTSCCIAHPTVMMRREVYEKIGNYDKDFGMGCCEDYDYWLRAVEHFNICNLDMALYTKREHPESNIGRARKETIQAFDELARLKSRIRRLR